MSINFPMQHIVQRAWQIVIPQENKLILLPQSTSCSDCLYKKTQRCNDFRLGDGPSWKMRNTGNIIHTLVDVHGFSIVTFEDRRAGGNRY